MSSRHLARNRPQLRPELLESRLVLSTVTVNTLNDSGPGSLRQAILDTNSMAGPDIIEFDAGLSGTIHLTTGQLTIRDALTLEGPGPENLSVDAGGLSRVLYIDDGLPTETEVQIKGVTITGGHADRAQGGGIKSLENLVLDNVVVTDNSTFAGAGGGVFAFGSTLTISQSTISGNTGFGALQGGGIFAKSLIMDQSQVIDNVGHPTKGVGVFGLESVTITDSIVSGNIGGGGTDGGGIHSYGDVMLTNSEVLNNYATFGGGIGTAPSGTVTLTGSTVSGNSAGQVGGGIAGGVLTSIRSTISGNSADDSGGGIAAVDITLIDSMVSGNSAGRNGGGISAGGVLTLTRSTVSGNSADESGGGITSYDDATLIDSTVSGNSAGTDGGGIFGWESATVSLIQSTVSGNSSLSNGGAIALKGRFSISQLALTLNQSTVTNNSAGSSGGGIHVSEPFSNSMVIIDGSIVADNTANVSGPDMRLDAATTLEVFFSLLGDNSDTSLAEAPAGMPDANGNLIGGPINGMLAPVLGPLQDNGGPTWTHALLPGSPAIDAGDAAAVAGVGGIPEFDQRGMPYGRVADGDGDMTARIDMGAYEVQSPPGPSCDFDGLDGCDINDIDALIREIAAGTDNPVYDLTGDGEVDLADRDQWLADAGAINLMSGNPYLLGDANLDGVVDTSDFNLWNNNKFTSVAAWSAGDFSADGVVDTSDFNLWNNNKFTSSNDQARSLFLSRLTMATRGVNARAIDIAFAGLDRGESQRDSDQFDKDCFNPWVF